MGWLSAIAQPADRVIAVVGRQAVTESDTRMMSMLDALDPNDLPLGPASEERAIHEAAVRERAGDVAVYLPDDERLYVRMQSLKESFPTNEAWSEYLSRHGVDENDLEAIVKRRLVVEQFIRRNVDVGPDDPDFQRAVRALFDDTLRRIVVRTIPPHPR